MPVLPLALMLAVLSSATPPLVEATDALAAESDPWTWSGEIKLNFRDTKDLVTPIFTPFPVTRAETPVQRTADPGASFELSTVNLRGEGAITSGVHAKVEVHLLDLYNRNPTSSDDRVVVREAWLRVGDGPTPAKPGAGKAYLLVGLAPRFTKQLVRRLDSYGMWGTAVGRFENPQVQAGGSFRRVYARVSLGNGNPLFLRDTNALAGDNGTPERYPGSPDRIYETGFPIFYDAKPADLNLAGRLEWGFGGGVRFEKDDRHAVDVMLWRFSRRLEDAARIRNTALRGDLDILRGEGFPLEFEGDHRHEKGLNVNAAYRGFRVFAQYVIQELAELERKGYEVELAWIKPLPGVGLLRESPVLTWVQPAIRVSRTDNEFEGRREFPSLSALWEYWDKYDVGVRVGIVRQVDLTIEYSRHVATVPRRPNVHPDEWLVTLRAGF